MMNPKTASAYDDDPHEQAPAAAGERVTLREVLRRRVFEEFGRRGGSELAGRVGNARQPGADRPRDAWHAFESALEAFHRRQFVVLVGDRQVEDLDDEVVLSPDEDITFLKLVPLAGG
ncbi:hypothetical protein [Streptomyces sp. H51]|uniref:hypothetical protein n=1 Tax=Streptomyces sp. H51 TaxID=3111770 RepID=UPI002D7665E7|nr:hypothetical protein [Streptomyces sp. H51]